MYSMWLDYYVDIQNVVKIYYLISVLVLVEHLDQIK